MATSDQAAARTRAQADWARLRARLATVTPGALARAGLTTAAALVVLGVALGTWPAVLPFMVGAVIAYAVVATFVIVKVTDLVLGLRVKSDVEEVGLDLAVHGEVAYQS